MNTRPNAQQYKEEMQDLLNKTEKLRQVIVTRLYTLCVSYPETPIARQADSGGTIIKAKSLIPVNRSKDYIKDLDFDVQIKFISVIEKFLADQHPHKQTEIKFATEDPICNCDGRDMPIYKEDGKMWCPQCGYEVK